MISPANRKEKGSKFERERTKSHAVVEAVLGEALTSPETIEARAEREVPAASTPTQGEQ